MKNKTVPEIRYKNIEDEWNLIKLSNLMNFSNGINAPKESYGRGRKMISVMDILSEERIEYKKIRNSVEVKESIESKNKVENGDLIFVRSSEVRNEVGWAKAYLQEQYALHSGFTIRGKKQNEYDAKFIECSLNFRNRHQIESKAGGSTRYNVGQEILKNVEIYIPPLKEQLLISTLIQNIENKINLHQQELDALKQTKQGFLQKMLPKNKNTEPALRFNGFDKAWKLKSFEMICKEFEYGLNASAKGFDGTNQYIRITDIDDETRTFFKDDLTSPDYDLSSADNYLLKKGDLLFARTGASVGKTYLHRENDGIVYYAGFLIRGRINQNFDSEFIFQNTLTSKFREFIKISSQRSGQPGINAKEIATYSFLVPEYEEQNKIGKFFRKLDEAIILKEQELEALKQTKQGFLQKMFV